MLYILEQYMCIRFIIFRSVLWKCNEAWCSADCVKTCLQYVHYYDWQLLCVDVCVIMGGYSTADTVVTDARTCYEVCACVCVLCRRDLMRSWHWTMMRCASASKQLHTNWRRSWNVSSSWKQRMNACRRKQLTFDAASLTWIWLMHSINSWDWWAKTTSHSKTLSLYVPLSVCLLLTVFL